MKVLPLALLVVASLLATLSTILFITERGAKLRTEAALVIAEAKLRRLETDLSANQARVEAAQAQLAAMEELKNKLVIAEQRIADLNNSLSQTKNLLLVRDQNELLLNRQIADANKALEAAQLVAAELERAKAKINEQEHTLAILQQRGVDIRTDAPDLGAAVEVVGPDNAFVVLNVGTRQGVNLNQKLYIRRGTEIIATVLTSEVREELTVAQVDPSNVRTVLHKGDSVLFDKPLHEAHP